MKREFQFKGFSRPNYTPIPDEFFDVLAPQLKEAELRVSLYIFRRTVGFKKPSDSISLRQLVGGITTASGEILDAGTGMAKPSVLRGLRGLEAKGVILAHRNYSPIRGHEPTTYSLHPDGAEPPLSPSVTSPSNARLPALVTKRYPQETEEQKTGKQETASSKLINSKGEPVPSTQRIVENLRSPNATMDFTGGTHPNSSERIMATVEEVTEDLADGQHRRSNCTQAFRLLVLSGLSESHFEAAIYQARSITRDEVNRRRFAPGRPPVANQMAYFFSVLRHELGLADSSRGQDDAGKETAE
jgi:hypothetical protein